MYVTLSLNTHVFFANAKKRSPRWDSLFYMIHSCLLKNIGIANKLINASNVASLEIAVAIPPTVSIRIE